MLYNDARKQIRNRLQKYSIIDVTIAVIEIINSPTYNKLEQQRKLPWVYLQILRICFENQRAQIGNWSISRPARLNEVINDLKKSSFELWNSTETTTDESLLIRLLRSLPVQATFQHGLSYEGLAWITSLTSLPNGHQAVQFFEKVVNVSPSDYLNTMFAINGVTLDSPARIISTDSFGHLNSNQSEFCKKLLNQIGITFDQLRNEIMNLKNKDSLFEKSELDRIPIFSKFPLVKIAPKHFLVLDQTCLALSIEEWLYKTLSKSDPNKFGNLFSKEFEKSVIDNAKNHHLDFLSEKELLNKYPLITKVIDGLWLSTEFNLLVEVKFTSKLRDNSATSSDRYFQHFGDIQEAVLQAIDFCKKTTLPPKPSYQIIITNRQRWAGSLEHIRTLMGFENWAQVCKERLHVSDDLISELPPAHIFILTWSQFESFLILGKVSQQSCAELLKDAAESSRKPIPTWILFNQLLTKHEADIDISKSHQRHRMLETISKLLPGTNE
jgi:hypothetical protein